MPGELSKQSGDAFIYSPNGEVFHRYFGVAHYSGRKTDRSHENISDSLWLPKESGEVYEIIVRERRSVFIEGSAGSGKSALLYGVRALFRRNHIPYYYIDGHYEKAPVEAVLETIKKAQNTNSNTAIILYDSADHLTGKSRKIRGLPIAQNRQRTVEIIRALCEFHDKGGLIAATSHDRQWIFDLADPELLPYWEEFKKKLYIHEVKGQFSGAEELIEFYQKSGLSQFEAAYIGRLMDNPNFITYLLNQKFGDKKYLEWLHKLFYSYRIAKLIVADKFKENEDLLRELKRYQEKKDNEVIVWNKYIDFVFKKHYRLLFHSKL